LLHRALGVTGSDDDDAVARQYPAQVAQRPLGGEREFVAVQPGRQLSLPLGFEACQLGEISGAVRVRGPEFGGQGRYRGFGVGDDADLAG